MAKGQQTRRRLLEATASLLKTTPLRKLSVAAIAEKAGTSPATFYVYFDEVPTAVLALVTDMLQRVSNFAEVFEEVKTAQQLSSFVRSYMAYLRRNSVLLRVRNLVCEEGDARFIKARYNSASSLVVVMAKRIEERQRLKQLPRRLHSYSAAVAFISALERQAITPSSQTRNQATQAGLEEAISFMGAVLLVD
jgi:AcrR family transcriptional regulator